MAFKNTLDQGLYCRITDFSTNWIYLVKDDSCTEEKTICFAKLPNERKKGSRQEYPKNYPFY